MDIGALLLLTAVMLITGLFISHPFLKNRRVTVASAKERELSTLLADRDRLIIALQDLDFDYTLGKIPSEDYPDMRTGLIQHAADVLRKLDKFQIGPSTPGNAEDRIEAVIAARRVNATQKSASSGPDALQADDNMEGLIAARKATRKEKSAGFCAGCGKAVLRSDRFCPHCGKPVS
jgi:hypothetical protein